MSTNTTLTVTEAKAALQRAEKEQAEQRRSKLLADLAAVHTALEKAEADYHRLAGQIKNEREQKAAIRGQMDHIISLQAEHERHRPVIAQYLPGDAGVVEWAKHRDTLEDLHAGLIKKLNAVPTTNMVLVAHFEGPTGTIATLRYSENNLLGALDPASRDAWFKGGIFAVG